MDHALLPARRGTPREILVPKTTPDFTLPTRRRITHIRHRRTINRHLKRKERLHTLADRCFEREWDVDVGVLVVRAV